MLTRGGELRLNSNHEEHEDKIEYLIFHFLRDLRGRKTHFIKSKKFSPRILAAIPDYPAGLNIKGYFPYIHIGFVAKISRKIHKSVHIGKIRRQAG